MMTRTERLCPCYSIWGVLDAMSKAELLAHIERLPAAKLAELEAIVAGMAAETSAAGPGLSREEIDVLRLGLFERHGYFDSTAAIRELRDNGPR